MLSLEYHRLRAWQGILEDVIKEYPTSSIPNALRQIKDRIKVIEERNKQEE